MKLRYRAPASAALIVMALSVQAALSAAKAQEKADWKDEYGNVLSSIGLGHERDPIDYTPRAPLVVPPTNDLPPPGDGSLRPAADFPRDPDEMARRKALVDPRQPVPPTEAGQARAYLIEPPAPYFDASAVAATGRDAGDKPEAGQVPAKRHHHHKQQQSAAAQ